MSAHHHHDIERELARAGFRHIRSRGSHHVYRDAAGRTLCLAAHGKRTYSAWQVERVRRDIIRARAKSSQQQQQQQQQQQPRRETAA